MHSMLEKVWTIRTRLPNLEGVRKMKLIREYTNAYDLAAEIAQELGDQFTCGNRVEFDYDRFEKPGDIRFTFVFEGMEIEIYYSCLVERYRTVYDFVKSIKQATS